MEVTLQQWANLATEEKNKLQAKLTPEDKKKIQDQWRKESEEERIKLAEAQRFIAMDRIVRAEQGKRYEPSEQARHMVMKMCAFGLRNTQIAETIGVSERTLRNYFEEELRQGRVEVDYMIIDTLFRKAMNGDTASLIFWAKTRCRWSEPPSQHEHSFNKSGSDTGKLANMTKLDEGEIAMSKVGPNGNQSFAAGIQGDK